MPGHRLSRDEFDRLLNRANSDQVPFEPPADSPMLHWLASTNKEQLTRLMVEVHCEPGDIICHEGNPGDAMYLIWSGRVIVVKGDLSDPLILSFRGAGEIIGEMALLENRPRSATTIAFDHVRLLRIEREAFFDWLNSDAEVSINIMSTLSARLRDADAMRSRNAQTERLEQRVEELESENESLLALQRVRKETSDLVVHDLRNPLGTIDGVLNMLEVVLPSEVLESNRELLDIGRSACNRMQRLVDSLLDVAKLETGQFAVQLSQLDLHPVLDEAAQRQLIPARLRNIAVQVVVPDDLPHLLVDADVLHRILGNLLDNALKYTREGGVVTLRCDAESDYLVISVIDQGPGIPPEERARIFERFAQVPNPQARIRGFGLGLTFCKLAIEAHGGEIWVEPGPDDVGSQFSFTLPYS